MSEQVKAIGVLTSGGDSPGMNAVVRAVVRRGLSKGLKVKGIRRGYLGLLNEEIIDMEARSVSNVMQHGGTILETERCPEFELSEVQEKLQEVQDENTYLTNEKTKLQDPDYVQSYARGNYMLTKDGEQIFYLPENTDK